MHPTHRRNLNEPPDDSQTGDSPAGEPYCVPSHEAARASTGGAPVQWEPPSIAEAARLFPQFEILGLLGCGGMGAVYKARQVALDRTVAIKLLPLEVSANPEFADRFSREARALAKLTHPNIIAVHDFGTTDEGHLFFVMEFVDGANLHSIIHEVGLEQDQALWLAGEICAALTYAHGKGVVHRDIKPANVMVDAESNVKVADFGLARLMDVSPDLHGMTISGAIMGTPDYMAPEQKRGMDVDHRADIYGVGVVLYEMICREVPQGAFELPSRRTGCDARVDAIVLKAMQQAPDRRYQSAREMEADLESARKPPPAPTLPPPSTALPPGLAAMPRPRLLPDAPVWRVPRPVAVPERSVTLQPPAGESASPVAPGPGEVKSRAPLYALVSVIVAAVIAGGGFTYQKLTAKHSGTPGANAPTEPPAAAPPPAPPVVEPPKEQPVVSVPEVKPPPVPVPEPPAPVPVPPPVPAPQPPPVAAAQSPTGKWLAEQEPQWQAAFAGEVTAPYEKGVADFAKQYLATLNTRLTAATGSGNLEAAVAYRDEIQAMTPGPLPPVDAPAIPAEIKALRAAQRKNLAALETDRVNRTRAIHARYDGRLAQSQTTLTQSQRIDEALEVKSKRGELAAAWLSSLPPPEVPVAKPPVPIPVPAPVGPVAVRPQPATGIVLGRDKLAADRGRVGADLGRLLAKFPKPAAINDPPNTLPLYQQVTFLMPFEQARQTLGLPAKPVSKGPVEWPGLPKDTFTYASYTGNFDAKFSQLFLVVDKAGQVVSVELMEDKPKQDDNFTAWYQAGDWHVYDFINLRAKGSPNHSVRNTLLMSDAGQQWNTVYRESSAIVMYDPNRMRLYRVDTALSDPSSFTVTIVNGQRYSMAKQMRHVRWYLPRPLADLLSQNLPRQ